MKIGFGYLLVLGRPRMIKNVCPPEYQTCWVYYGVPCQVPKPPSLDTFGGSLGHEWDFCCEMFGVFVVLGP